MKSAVKQPDRLDSRQEYRRGHDLSRRNWRSDGASAADVWLRAVGGEPVSAAAVVQLRYLEGEVDGLGGGYGPPCTPDGNQQFPPEIEVRGQ